ncbi:MAG: hypothetical protein AB7L71_19970 [Vicinamibacterales bacterium]
MTQTGASARVRRLVGTAVVTALLTTVSAPAFAATPDKTPDPLSKRAIAAVVAATPPTATPAAAAPSAPAPKAPKQSGGDSFFKSRTGILVLGAFVVGTGYAIYSAKNDRIKGLNR